MANYGMGRYEQFFGHDDGTLFPLSDDAVDEWRATSLTYGHAGAWTTDTRGRFLSAAEELKEYFTMHSLQRRYLDAPLRSVRYVSADGAEHDLSAALANDLDLAGPRLHIVYGPGGTPDLELWVNHGAGLWTVRLAGEDYALPSNGWLARGAGGLLAYSALFDGRRVDVLDAPEWTLLDGRGRPLPYGSRSSEHLTVFLADGRVLREDASGEIGLESP
jgi:hypothetical protein